MVTCPNPTTTSKEPIRWRFRNKSVPSCGQEPLTRSSSLPRSKQAVARGVGEVHCAAVVVVPVERRAVLRRRQRSLRVLLEGYLDLSLLHASRPPMRLVTSATTAAAKDYSAPSDWNETCVSPVIRSLSFVRVTAIFRLPTPSARRTVIHIRIVRFVILAQPFGILEGNARVRIQSALLREMSVDETSEQHVCFTRCELTSGQQGAPVASHRLPQQQGRPE